MIKGAKIEGSMLLKSRAKLHRIQGKYFHARDKLRDVNTSRQINLL